ncbi:MAG: hypothetical protein J0L99_10105 [Chitinophagales bacterium]|nr:hypothetical protein [Chitinophagales bacterium]
MSEMTRLYDYIMEYSADEQSPFLDKKYVFQYFFPDRPFRDKEKGPIDTLTTDLLSLVKRFLVWLEQRNRGFNEFEETLTLLRFYRKFGMEERFQQSARSLISMLDTQPVRDAAYYQMRLALSEEVYSSNALLSPYEVEMESLNVHYNLNMYFALRKIDYLCAIKTQKQLIGGIGAEPDFMEALNMAVLQFIGSELNQKNIPLQLFSAVLDLNAGSVELEKLRHFKAMLQLHEHQLSEESKKTLNTHLRNFYAWLYSRTGSSEIQHELFDVLKEHLKKGYLYFDGYLHVANLRMLTTHALKLGHSDWIREVLEKHPAEKLCGTKFTSEALDLNWAEYYFYLKNYTKAEQQLVYRPFEHPVLGIHAEILLLKIYFETQSELLDARLNATRQKVRRSKLSPEIKQRHLNFIRLLTRLERLRWQNDSKLLSKFIKEIETTPDVQNREWLIGISEQLSVNSYQ